MNEIPRKARGRRTEFFDSEGMDELVSGLLELTAEVSVLSERMYVMERVLETHGIDAANAIEHYQFNAEEDEQLEAERRRLIETVLRNFMPGGAEAAQSAPEIAAENQDSLEPKKQP